MIQDEVEQYIKDLKEHPEKRMFEIRINDEIVFLKQDQKDKGLWNFGFAKVLGITSKDNSQKSQLAIKDLKEVFLISPSFPFQLYAEPQHLLRNYSDEKRKV